MRYGMGVNPIWNTLEYRDVMHTSQVILMISSILKVKRLFSSDTIKEVDIISTILMQM